MRYLAFIACMFIFAGCNVVDHSKAKNLVKEALVDPESARFENVVSTETSTCGWVNSKNRMGGFVGAQRFLVQGTFEIFMDSSPTSVENGSMSKWFAAFLECVGDDTRAAERNSRELFRDIGTVSRQLEKAP